MWFTRISLKNPVFATMLMLALVVLGLFAYQRLQVDQFPNIDFPVVVITTEYPGASPEIVESEVTKKIEEGVNSIAGINALTSRSYDSMSVVVIEFQLTIDGRKAAEDVREKVATLRANLRMNAMANPGGDKVDFELASLAVSAVNGCGMCLESHEKTLRKHGLSAQPIQSAARIAAVIHAVAVALAQQTGWPAIVLDEKLPVGRRQLPWTSASS